MEQINIQSLFIYCISVIITMFFLRRVNAGTKYAEEEWCFSFDGRSLVLNKGIIAIVFAFLPMWVLVAFRDKSVGIDAGNIYYRTYQFFLNGSYANTNAANNEIGYEIIYKICLMFSDSYQLILIVTGTITWLLFFSYTIKESLNPKFSILILFLNFFYFHQFNTIRQFIAMGIVLMGFRYIYERNIIKYLIIIGIASLFHTSALLAVIFYFFWNTRITPLKSFVAIIGSKVLFSLVLRILRTILASTRYYAILFSNDAYKSGYTWGDLICNAFLLIVGMIVFVQQNEWDQEMNFNLAFQTMAMILAINSNNIPIPFRLLWYANINTMIFVPLLLDRVKLENNKRLLRDAIVVMFTLYFIYNWFNITDAVQSYSFWKA